MSDSGNRPRVLTMSSWLVVVASAFLVLIVFDAMANLNSVESRNQLSELLTSDTGAGLGMSMDQALSLMRVLLTITAGCAAAAAVLGVYALQRHRAARLALTVLAVPILVATSLTAWLTGGFVGALVAAGIAMMWSGQARDWFAGRPVREPTPLWGRGLPTPGQRDEPGRPEERPTQPQEPARHPGPDAGPVGSPQHGADLSTGQPSTQPGPVSGYGDAPVTAPVLDRPEGQRPGPAYPWPGAGQPAAPVPAGRVPAQVRLACVLTWLFSGLVALVYVGIMVFLAVDSSALVDEVVASPTWKRADLDPDLLVPALWIGCVMFLGWALAAMLLAWFTWRRHGWARYLLVASAGAAFLAGFFAFPFGAAHQLAAAAVVWALFTPPARRWFESPGGPSGPPPGGGWSGQAPGAPPPHQQQPPSGPPYQQEPPRGGKPPVW